ncbi:hypothetical protein J4460_00335 [Candidatus Woesearchaeota archaeon]|nr:MAG: hypothetical protein QS99_C0002G0121 [archaeon GW2011_AR4]MBS3129097.1 hypothetical protein [Candidatus Woesearchaeota archaeon]HIH37829.1 hypothetical protein [Candidatus Woesearchaeota archaeon]HIH49277.1 hypothetical protein [Candidatus Woesearchaeota archaeon]HIJ03954.1 hypothetical protein [Candidatus Woesearchaeota archaeon]
MSKKAQVEVQFNWVFVLIAGALILLFFVTLVSKAKVTAEKNMATDVLQKLDTIIAGSQTSAGTVQTLDFPKLETSFSCDGYRISDIQAPVERAYFAPSSIKDDKLIVWTLEYDMPFRIMNLVYMTSPGVRYIFDGDGSDAFQKRIKGEIPHQVGLPEEVSTDWNTALYEKSSYRVRIISFNADPDPSILTTVKKSTPLARITAVKIGTPSPITIAPSKQEIYGDLTFYRSNAAGTGFVQVGTAKYVGLPMLFGAIFSDDPEFYACAVGRVNNRLQNLLIITETKKSVMKGNFLPTNVCYSIYTSTFPTPHLSISASGGVTGDVNQWSLFNSISETKSCGLLY